MFELEIQIVERLQRFTRNPDPGPLCNSFTDLLADKLKHDQIYILLFAANKIIRPEDEIRPDELFFQDYSGRFDAVNAQQVECIAGILGNQTTNPCTILSGITRLVLPINSHLGIHGVILIDDKTLSSEEMALCKAYISFFGDMLFITSRSDRDGLTGLQNRSQFDRQLNQIVESLRQAGKRESDQSRPDYLCLLDIDHFKKINDTFGHLYGDEVLLLFSQIMQNVFRQKDWLFRYGGEEFAVILENIDQQHVYPVLNRFRQAIEEYDFPQVGRVTVSIGYTLISKELAAPELISQADSALYYSKENGRNQVSEYDYLVNKGLIVPPQTPASDVELF